MYSNKNSKVIENELNSMNNKNYEYIKQNIAITQIIFLTSGYIQYILKKKIKKNQIFNNTSLITSIKHKRNAILSIKNYFDCILKSLKIFSYFIEIIY